MLKNYQHQKELQRERIEGKSCESLFSHIIVQGTNCSRFESEIIVEKAKEVSRVGEWSQGRTLQPGQMVYIAVSATEPAGKPLDECAKERIVLTHIDIEADSEVLHRHGAQAKRHTQILRMTDEARKQGALLTQEDLAMLLDCDVRTIRRDIKALKEQRYVVATRGQQKDIGRGVTHKQQAVRFYLEGMEPLDIARRIKHSLKAVERYIDAFCRVVYCKEKGFDVFRTALIIGVSAALVRDHLDIYNQYRHKEAYTRRAEEVARKGRLYWENQDFKKKSSQTGGPNK